MIEPDDLGIPSFEPTQIRNDSDLNIAECQGTTEIRA